MRAVIQRVSKASVTINCQVTGTIDNGIVVLLGIKENDTEEDIEWLCGKIARLRIFPDDDGVMNLSIKDVDGKLMVISQFTLHASTKKGNRPSYINAAPPLTAIPLYEKFLAVMENELGKRVARGEFGAMMDVALVNNGPVTIIIDTKNRE